MGLAVGLPDVGRVGQLVLNTVQHGEVLCEPHSVAARGCVHAEALLGAPLAKGLVALVQRPAIAQGLADFTPQLALLGSSGLDAGPSANASEDYSGGDSSERSNVATTGAPEGTRSEGRPPLRASPLQVFFRGPRSGAEDSGELRGRPERHCSGLADHGTKGKTNQGVVSTAKPAVRWLTG